MAFLLFGLSLVAGLRYLGPKIDLTHQKSVSGQMSDPVRKSLWAFVARNYRLPCPADGSLTSSSTNFGIEQPLGGGVCTITGANAVVPWITLGLPQNVVQDAWGNQLGYSVTAALTSGTPFKSTIPTSDAVQVSVGTPAAQAYPYAYVLMSFGPDGGSYNLNGKQVPVGTASKLTSTETQYEGTNRTAIAGGGLATAFVAAPTPSAPQGTGSAFGAAGAVGGQWLVFENSKQICADINGTSGKTYCQNIPPAQNGPSNTSTLSNSQASSQTNTLAVTSSTQTSNPNGVSSNAVLVTTGDMPVLVLGTNTTTPSLSSAPAMYNSSQACSWLAPMILTGHTLRAYFEFSTAGTNTGDGFTMTFLPGATDLIDSTPCGGTPGGNNSGNNTNEGSYLGFVQITDGGNTNNGTTVASVSVSSNAISAITVSPTKVGAGYLYIPPVEITGAGNSATAAVSSAQINNINVTYPGNGYYTSTLAAGTSITPNVTIAPAGGAGYVSPPTVTIESATATGCTGSGCSNATGTATINGSGRVTGLSISSAGSGYLRAPAVWLSGSSASGCTSGCADAIGASSTISSAGVVTGLYIGTDNCSPCGYGRVNSMDVRSLALVYAGTGYGVAGGNVASQYGGAGYSSAPTVHIHGIGPDTSGGIGAQATATMNASGAVTNIGIQSAGSGYTSNNVVVTLVGGGMAYVTISEIIGGAVTQAGLTLTDGGSNYPANTTLPFTLPLPLNCTGGCNNPATATATIGPGGAVASVTLTSGGSGYTSSYDQGNVAPITHGTDHVAATLTATVGVNGTIAGITSPGNYTPVPVTITAVNEANPSTPATALATVGSDGTISGVTMTSYGAGYTNVPKVTIADPPGCSSPCPTTAAAQVFSMGVHGIVADVTNNRTGYSGSFTAMPSIGIDPPSQTICTTSCFPATAAANISISAINVPNAGSGYTQNSTAATLPPPLVLPKFALEFRTYHHPTDPFYSDYSYHDDWGFFGGYAGVTYFSPTSGPGALASYQSTHTTYSTTTNMLMPQAAPVPAGALSSAPFTQNIRHDDSTGCDGDATVSCVPEYMALLMVDAPHHDDTYHYSTFTGGSRLAGADNTAYTISSSCDSTAGSNVSLHNGGFIAGGWNTRGTLGSIGTTTAPGTPTTGGCTYDNAGGTNIVTTGGPITDPQNKSGFTFHAVRLEIQRYCDPTCGSCGNPGTPGDSYMHVAAYLDCDSAALGGQSCSDMTQNLLMAGSKVYSITLTNVGSGYTADPTVTITGGGGSGATATATHNTNNGTVNPTIVVNTPGSGYSSAPTVTISGGGGTGAQATASLSGLPLTKAYSGTSIYAVNYCTSDPGAVNWTSSARGLSSFDSIVAGFTSGAGAATRGAFIRNLHIGTYN